jgi:glycogen synthase
VRQRPSNCVIRRLLMTTETLGGVYSYSLGLLRELTGEGWEIALATMGPPPTPAQRAELRSLRGVEVFESCFQLEWMDDPWRDVDAAGDWLLDLEHRTKPDAIHLNGYSHAVLPWTAPILVVGHSCALSWWVAVFGEAPPDRYDEYRRRVSRGLAAASALVTPTHGMLSNLAARYGPLPPAYVISNGVKISDWQPGPKESLFLATGRLWDRAKNLAVLNDIAGELPWPVHVAGERCAIESPRSNRMVLLGRLDQRDLAERLSRAAVFVHPACYEPFGLAPVEAACCGCALLLGDIETLREVWGDAAVYVDPCDRNALVGAAHSLASNHVLRRDLAARARDRAARYCVRRMARAYIACPPSSPDSPREPMRPASALEVR